MGGLNLAAKLKQMGISAGKTDQTYVKLDAIWVHPEGHPLRHPRIDDPVDLKLRDDIAEKGILKPLLVRWGFDDKENPVLELCDGSQRLLSGLAAWPLMKKAQSNLLVDGHVRAPVIYLPGDCTDAQFLLARQMADSDPFKKKHTTRVLAKSACQMLAAGLTPEQILEVLPREWTSTHIEVVGRLWHTLAPDVVDRFEHGAPVGLLPAVLEAKPKERMVLLDNLLAAGMSSVQGATRFVNRMSAAAATEAPAESEEAAEAEESAETSEVLPEVNNNGAAEPKKRAPAPVKKSVKKSSGEALNAKTVNKRIAQARQQSKMTAALNLFLVGAQLALGDRKQMDAILTIAKGLDPMTQNLIAGVFWRYGAWTPEIQAMTSDKVMSWVEEGDARPSPRAEKMTKKNGKKK